MSSGYALVFPGQGSQYVGMGRGLWNASAKARELFTIADDTLSYRLSGLCFEGPEAELRETANAQPAILVVSIAAFTLLREAAEGELSPRFVAGHSLGEFSALVAAGALSFADALRLVRRRGELMSAAGQARPGTMAAVLGLDDGEVEAACAEAAFAGIVVVANYNSAGQTVISGEPAAVERAGEIAKAKGARRVIPLPVSGAFHSPLMEPALEPFRRAVAECRIADPRWPVVGNVGARPLDSADEVRRELGGQLVSPVRWARSIEYMAEEGTGLFVEVGPGQVLAGLIKRNRALRATNVEGPDSAASVALALRGGS